MNVHFSSKTDGWSTPQDLFDELNKNNYLTFDKFSEYLIRLNNLNRIQLESGMSSDEFSITDSYGNVFKLIRIMK